MKIFKCTTIENSLFIVYSVASSFLISLYWEIASIMQVKMLRRLLNSVIESSLQPYQQDYLIYPHPFIQKELSSFNWLATVAPCFPVNAQNITILTEPQQFYNFLVEKCLEAKNRITLASLYLGNGKLEQALVDKILCNKDFVSGNLKISVLLDYTRGSRYQNNSRAMLRPLLEKNEENCHICLYHTPVLRGLTRSLVPNRWNEIFGLQHMKLYIFDDTLVISGANLSNDYFTNRQDRYFVIKDKTLTDFYSGLVSNVQSFSLKMDKNNNLTLNEGWEHFPYKGNKMVFVEKAAEKVENYLLDAKDQQNSHKTEGFDTWIFPLVQMGQLGIEQDAYVTKRLIAEAPEGSKICMATGYFNLTQQYMDTIVSSCLAECHLLMAHPNANGFQGAAGAAGGIPDAYSLIAKTFVDKVEKLGQADRVRMFEYLRDGWTYHAKGLWYYPCDSKLPCLTLIGSPNFGERSVKRDLETQLAIVTENEELRRKLHEENMRLYEHSLPANLNRIIPKWIHAAVYLFRSYF